MRKTMPTMPVSELRKRQSEVIAAIETEPYLLTHKGHGAGVLVSVKEWDAIAQEMDELRKAVAMLRNALAVERKGQKVHKLTDMIEAARMPA
ncbi:type II toxin-antitoxin system prevent-host-death family antitoxin [Chloroflexi bacterium TSY]|nr:type II toxin-antitoxin system prevent-host-death family antitoxin [Chloroflexi bacterium TSY]